MIRFYVHFSPDHGTARNIGRRHEKPILLRINRRQMAKDGCIFYRTVNGVWLTKEVSVKYFTVDN
ncbi:MAG: hypothetical protein E7239_12230 [Sarcina sp.]|nr:hypothetical protein [Sarcina sp.]MBE6018610.1 hypothetical protein [Lachnospiraceae bacterium]